MIYSTKKNRAKIIIRKPCFVTHRKTLRYPNFETIDEVRELHYFKIFLQFLNIHRINFNLILLNHLYRYLDNIWFNTI